jgi:hypothetical protein
VVIVTALQTDAYQLFFERIKDLGVDLPQLIGNYSQHSLRQLRPDEVKELLKAYLSLCAASSDALEIFSDSAVDKLHELSEGVPRRVINYAGRILEEFSKREYESTKIKDKHIDKMYFKLSEEVQRLQDILHWGCAEEPDKVLEGYGVYSDPTKLIRYLQRVIYYSLQGAKSTECTFRSIDGGKTLTMLCSGNATVFSARKGLVKRPDVEKIVDKVRNATGNGKKPSYIEIAVLSPEARIARTAIDLALQLRSEGVDLRVLSYRDNPLVKLFAACITYYAENYGRLPKSFKERLTFNNLLRLMKATLELHTIPIQSSP